MEECSNIDVDAPTVLPRDKPLITIRIIQERVAARYSVTLLDLLSEKRNHRITEVRHIAMWICFQLTPRSSTAIGKMFDRDHSTVLVSIKKIEEMRRDNRDLRICLDEFVDDLRKQFTTVDILNNE